jgi:drug/metabolite transporter (DMT)-like permease
MRPKLNSIIGVILAVIGLLLLSGGNPLNWNRGDFLVLISAIIFTFHIIYTGKFSRENDIYILTAVQLSVTGALSIITLIISQTPFYLPATNNLLLLVYLALFGTVYTFLMQTAMQKHTTNTRAALVFSMEPVFAAIFAFIVAGETLKPIAWIGGILILLGMLSAELEWIGKKAAPEK